MNVTPGGTLKPKHWALKGQMLHPCRFGCVPTAASKSGMDLQTGQTQPVYGRLTGATLRRSALKATSHFRGTLNDNLVDDLRSLSDSFRILNSSGACS